MTLPVELLRPDVIRKMPLMPPILVRRVRFTSKLPQMAKRVVLSVSHKDSIMRKTH